MKDTFLVLFLLHFLAGCGNEKFNHRETVTKYYTPEMHSIIMK